MKKLPLLLTTLLLMATLIGCSGTNPKPNPTNTTDQSVADDPVISDAVQEVEDAAQLKEILGKDISIAADDSSYAIIAQSIGEVTFTREDISYNLRASKDLVGDAMAGIESAMVPKTVQQTIDDIKVTFGSFEDGTLIAFWTDDDLNYTLTCKDGDQSALKETFSYVMNPS